MPFAVQLRRAKGWRMPPNTRSVARPGPFGNPYRVQDPATARTGTRAGTRAGAGAGRSPRPTTDPI